ncbi:LAMI_0H04038g1_1 [Lachancea mirantina]|uniref:LAMI_0H04038g1_1 n=1 Tax=Lachancea mirantina TaxID=1230905 RepID=A0A1G4KEQ8_9SACH|nr:LAMI_0H04038g1_1 [Lachancea mirantina]
MSQRLAKEYRSHEKTLASDKSFSHVVDLSPVSDEDLRSWKATIEGPPKTPYEGFEFQLELKIPQRYPLDPPQVSFLPRSTPHCNVDYDTGRICLDILEKDSWSPAWDLLHVTHAIWLLLANPVPDSPLDVDLACILRANDTSAYNGLVRYYLKDESRD